MWPVLCNKCSLYRFAHRQQGRAWFGYCGYGCYRWEQSKAGHLWQAANLQASGCYQTVADWPLIDRHSCRPADTGRLAVAGNFAAAVDIVGLVAVGLVMEEFCADSLPKRRT